MFPIRREERVKTVSPKFPEDLRRAIGERAVAGESPEDLAAEVGCSPVSVVVWAARVRDGDPDAPLLPHPGARGHPQVVREVAVAEKARGVSLEDAAARHGVSPGTLSRWVTDLA